MTAIARLRSRLAGPSAVLIGSTAAINVLRIGNTMLLTRLLAPADFGLAGIMLSALYILGMISDTGYQGFVVRDPRGDDPHFLDVVWTLHVIRGFLLCALVIALAWPLSLFTAKHQLLPLMIGVSPLFAIEGFMSAAPFTAVRHGNVRKLSLIDLAGTIVQMIAGLVAGAILRDAWAIVVAMLANSLVRTIASYVLYTGTRRRFRLDDGLAGELWRFSRVIAASSAITLVISQVDKLVLARMLTLADFGTYTIASNLAAAPAGLALIYVTRIVYPAVARAWREAPEAIGAAIYRTRGLVFLGYLFAGGGLVGAAPLVIRLIYDPRYLGASPYLRILSLSAMLVMLTRSISESLVAIGRTRATLVMNIARLGWLAAAGTAGLVLYGPIGLVTALGLIELPAYLYGLSALAGARLLDPRREALAVAVMAIGLAIGYAAAVTVQHVRPA